MANLLFEYTSGYPFLVSRLCQLIDEEISIRKAYGNQKAAWTKAGFQEAVRIILAEKNTLFESMMEKLFSYLELDKMLKTLLFTGKNIIYNADEPDMDMARMFGFIKNQNGIVAITNRIFEIRLYNYYLSSAEMQGEDIYMASL